MESKTDKINITFVWWSIYKQLNTESVLPAGGLEAVCGTFPREPGLALEPGRKLLQVVKIWYVNDMATC